MRTTGDTQWQPNLLSRLFIRAASSGSEVELDEPIQATFERLSDLEGLGRWVGDDVISTSDVSAVGVGSYVSVKKLGGQGGSVEQRYTVTEYVANARIVLLGKFGGGPIAFVKLLEDWRAAGTLQGLEFR